MGEKTFSIGEVAEKLMIHPNTIRNWVSRCLIKPPKRSWAGCMVFSERDISEIAKVQNQRIGIALENIKVAQGKAALMTARRLKSISKSLCITSTLRSKEGKNAKI